MDAVPVEAPKVSIVSPPRAEPRVCGHRVEERPPAGDDKEREEH